VEGAVTTDPRAALIAVFEEARGLLALADNDFSWSSWVDFEAAALEIDGILGQLRREERPDILAMEVIFAPSGPMQEVSLSSGWADAFLDLAGRFDAALHGREYTAKTTRPWWKFWSRR